MCGLMGREDGSDEQNEIKAGLLQLNELIDVILCKKSGNRLTDLFNNNTNTENCSEKNILEFIICDSIFSLYEITRLLNSYGVSSLISYSFFASVHAKLYEWIILLNIYVDVCSYINFIRKNILINSNELIRTQDVNQHLIIVDQVMRMVAPNIKASILKTFEVTTLKREATENLDIDEINPMIPNREERSINDEINLSLRTKLLDTAKHIANDPESIHIDNGSEFMKKFEELIGTENMPYITANYQQRKAIKYYYAALGTHKEGIYYKDQLMKMNYLNGDFCDTWFHFTMAIERYRINTEKIRKELKSVKGNSEGAEMYNHDNYLKTCIDREL
jgi:hypothetical protein